MKYALVIGDGMADAPLEQLAGKTPLEALALPAFDRVAGCLCGRALTVPHGLAPGSDTAILSIFGYDPRHFYTGRSALEAAGMGVDVPADSLSFRVNLCSVLPGDHGALTMRSHNGGGIRGEDARRIMDDLLAYPALNAKLREIQLQITPTDSFRHIGVMKSPGGDIAGVKLAEPHNILGQPIDGFWPQGEKAVAKALEDVMRLSYDVLCDHPVNRQRQAEGLLPANMVWPWGLATAMTLPSFASKYGHGGSVISAVPLVWGIASLAGLKTPRVPGANGELDTNYEGKADAAVDALLAGDDFVAVHVEAPDEMTHAGNLAAKLEAIQNVESRVVARMLDRLSGSGQEHRLLLLSDHLTLMRTRTHDGSPVPFALYDSRAVRRAVDAGQPAPLRKFCEAETAAQPLLADGTDLMPLLFGQEQSW